jgi:hypothetical protein
MKVKGPRRRRAKAARQDGEAAPQTEPERELVNP